MAIFLPYVQAKKPSALNMASVYGRFAWLKPFTANPRRFHRAFDTGTSVTADRLPDTQVLGAARGGWSWPEIPQRKTQSCCIQRLQEVSLQSTPPLANSWNHWGVLAPTSVLPRYRSAASKVSRTMEFSGFIEQKKSLWVYLSSKKLQEMSKWTKSFWVRLSLKIVGSGYRE